MITGMMLLKICDPDYETPALADFSMGFSLLSLSGLITTPLTLAVIASGSTMANFLFSLAVTGVFWAILAVVTVGSRVSARPDCAGSGNRHSGRLKQRFSPVKKRATINKGINTAPVPDMGQGRTDGRSLVSWIKKQCMR